MTSNANAQLRSRAHNYAARRGEPLLDPTEKILAQESAAPSIIGAQNHPAKNDDTMSPRPEEDQHGMVPIPDGDCESTALPDTSCGVNEASPLEMQPHKNLDENDMMMTMTTQAHTPYYKSSQMLELIFCVGFYIGVTMFFASSPVETYMRPIPYQYLENSGDYILDASLSESNMGSTVSPTIVCIIALIIQQGLCLVRSRWSTVVYGVKSFYDNHSTLCVYVVALAINRLVGEWVKNYVGYLRPIFYEKCEPDDNYEYCTDNDSGGRKSFPSGHASMSFCGLTLLTLYIHTRLGMGNEKRLQQEQRQQRGLPSYWTLFRARMISLAGLLPLALAVYIAADRVRTNHHFPADVVGGALLGGSVSVFVHGLWF